MLSENAFKEMPTLADKSSDFGFSSGIQVYFWTQRSFRPLGRSDVEHQDQRAAAVEADDLRVALAMVAEVRRVRLHLGVDVLRVCAN